MRVAIRVDSSPDVGSGHLMRCLALAAALREIGVNATFVMRNHDGNLNQRVVDSGFTLRSLPLHHAEDQRNLPRLGADVYTDAEETVDFLNDYRPNWLVVDHYSLDWHWESAVRIAGMRILVIDDLANRAHDCDALLDQNFPPVSSCRYENLVPSGCVLYLGPQFALLNPNFALHRVQLMQNPGLKRDGIVVSFGSSNILSLAEMTCEALNHPSLQEQQVNLVLGADPANFEDVLHRFSNRPKTQVMGPQPHLASLMSSARLAIGAGGSTIWERRCLGLASVVVSIAPNQEHLCRVLGDLGIINYLGALETASSDLIRVACEDELMKAQPLIASEATSPYDADGRGANRIAQFMILE